MHNKRLRTTWSFTGLVAILLLLSTVVLFVRAKQIEDTGLIAYVTGPESVKFLREQPSNNGAVLSILENGMMVRIIDSATRENTDWYRVEVAEQSGWLRASQVDVDPPEPPNE